MKKKQNVLSVAFAAASILIGLADTAHASVIITSGAGSAVTSADAVANFDSLTNGSSLASYSEAGLSVTIPTTDFTAFDPTAGNGALDGAFLLNSAYGGFFYSSGGPGSLNPVIIQPLEGGRMSGLEFDLGNGFGTTQTFLAYITDNGSGVTSASSGSIIGFLDPGGFSFLKIGAYGDLATAQAELNASLAGPDGNGIAIDNLRVQSAGATAPEPGTALLLLAALTALSFMRTVSSRTIAFLRRRS